MQNRSATIIIFSKSFLVFILLTRHRVVISEIIPYGNNFAVCCSQCHHRAGWTLGGKLKPFSHVHSIFRQLDFSYPLPSFIPSDCVCVCVCVTVECDTQRLWTHVFLKFVWLWACEWWATHINLNPKITSIGLFTILIDASCVYWQSEIKNGLPPQIFPSPPSLRFLSLCTTPAPAVKSLLL